MGETLTKRRRVRDEGLRVVNRCHVGRNPVNEEETGLTYLREEAPANSVPAAAVIRRERALFGITGRKGCVGGQVSRVWKAPAQLVVVHTKLSDLSAGEESGIPGVAVECVDIRKNTGGEGGSLARN